MADAGTVKMRAARFYNHHDIRVESVPKPTPEAHQILVDVVWCGVCGTDIHEYGVGPLIINPKDRPHQITGKTLPLIMGHEFVGHVVGTVPRGAVTADHKELKTGDVVVLDPRINCKSCLSCSSGQGNVCGQWGFVGLNGDGGFAETVAVDPSMCYSVPAGFPLDHAALIEPLAVGRHALASASVPLAEWKDQSVLVIGGGPVGFSVLCNLRVAGVRKVFVSEPSTRRREQTKDWVAGAFDPTQTAVPTECLRLTDGKGVDIVFDCAGITPGMRDGMKALRPRGTYVNVAGWETDFVLPLEFCMMKELTLRMSIAYNDNDFDDVVRDLFAGRFAGAEAMITARISLEDIVDEGFEQLLKNKDKHVKILVSPRKDIVPGKRV